MWLPDEQNAHLTPCLLYLGYKTVFLGTSTMTFTTSKCLHSKCACSRQAYACGDSKWVSEPLLSPVRLTWKLPNAEVCIERTCFCFRLQGSHLDEKNKTKTKQNNNNNNKKSELWDWKKPRWEELHGFDSVLKEWPYRWCHEQAYLVSRALGNVCF